MEQGDRYKYFQVLAMESALISYMVAGSFINIYRSEAYYWMMIFIACAANVYLFKSLKTVSSEVMAE
jgi:hypothetical protein